MKALKEIAKWLGMAAVAFAMLFALWLFMWTAYDMGIPM